jgi:endonuclease YncB( thermonuclease family)
MDYIRSMFDSKRYRAYRALQAQRKYEDTVPYIPPITKGMVIKVYDGDTITIATKLPHTISSQLGLSRRPTYRFSVRLLGIDCPEMRPKKATNADEEAANADEKAIAAIAKNAVEDMVLNKVVVLKNVSTEKYGRILADVYIGDVCLSEYQLRKRHAVPYDGKTKKIPNSWKAYYNCNENV